MLHEVMEQQTLSITKAGIICQLNARTSILAAANPVESQWSKNKTIIDNINLPHTLLSRFVEYQILSALDPKIYLFRFDLIFLILDPQDELYDRRLAKHLVGMYQSTPEEDEQEFMVSIVTSQNNQLIINEKLEHAVDEGLHCVCQRAHQA